MRAVVLDSIGSPLRVDDDHAEPAAGDGTVIDVTACGVCHSDLHVVDGDFPSPLPLVLGHEVTGVHAELGPVIVYAPWGCGRCPQCADGLDMICGDATEAGLFTDGGYAERMHVRDVAFLHPLGDLDPVASAPLACGGLTAYRAVRHALGELDRLGRPGRVMVIGAGGLGQFAIRYLRLLSEATVIAVDLATDKRATALDIGAHEAAGPDEVADAAGSIDVVIDFIGAESTLTIAAASVAKQGAVVVVGLAGGRIPFGFAAVAHEARFLTSVWGSRTQLDELLALARHEPVIVGPVDVMSLADAQLAHDRLRAGDTRGRIVLVP